MVHLSTFSIIYTDMLSIFCLRSKIFTLWENVWLCKQGLEEHNWHLSSFQTRNSRKVLFLTSTNRPWVESTHIYMQWLAGSTAVSYSCNWNTFSLCAKSQSCSMSKEFKTFSSPLELLNWTKMGFFYVITGSFMAPSSCYTLEKDKQSGC